MKIFKNKSILYGLVLTGGKSTRMKKDKAALVYHGKEQAIVCFELLASVCEKVFISSRVDQISSPAIQELPQIYDRKEFSDSGPLAGILSAMHTHPDAAWLVLACDLPYVDQTTLQFLIDNRNPQKTATAYRSSHDGLPEPLCAIYEPQGVGNVLAFLKKGITCPQKILINSDTHLIEPQNPQALENINNPDEYQQAKDTLKTKYQ